MGNAIWLLLALPLWYLLAALSPLAAGPLTLVPAAGVLGVGLGMSRGGRSLPLFLIPFAASELLVAVAGIMRGHGGGAGASTALVAFLVAQVALSVGLLVLNKGARAPAAALAIFSITYAAFSAAVATMSFSDTWL